MVRRRFRWTRKTYRHAHQLARQINRWTVIPDDPPPIVRRYWELWRRHDLHRTDPLLEPLHYRLDRYKDRDIPF